MRVLMPRGTFTARPGLPATVLVRGVFAGAFFGVEAFVPLTLTAVHGFSPAMSGLPLTVGAIGWAAASHWQGRYPDLDRATLIRVGLLAQAAALAAMALVGADWGLAWLVLPFWLVAGRGHGPGVPVDQRAVARLRRTQRPRLRLLCAAGQRHDVRGDLGRASAA